MTGDELKEMARHVTVGQPVTDADAVLALVTVARASPALADLVKACEELDRMWSGGGVYTAIAGVLAALQRVHEVKP
jgi:hypothetical protein